MGLAAFTLIALLSLLSWGQALENPALDFCYRLRPTLPPPADLLIVGIDEASFQEMRRPWPWPRRFHAELVNRLAAYRRQDWSRAADRFQQSLQQNPDDLAARLFLNRCRYFLKHPPPPDWQGVYVMKEK